MDLDIHVHHINALKRHGVDPRDHQLLPGGAGKTLAALIEGSQPNSCSTLCGSI
jgi:hypothetical protein